MSEIHHVDPNSLEPSEHHIRGETDVDDDFVTSASTVGIVEPPITRPEDGEIRVVDGMRRAIAARKAGIDQIPVLVEDMDDAEAIMASITLNGAECFIKSVTEADRDRSLRRAGGGDRKEGERRVGIRTEADRITEAVEHCYGVGPATIDALIGAFDTREDLEGASIMDLQSVPGVGEETAKSIRRHLDLEDGTVEIVERNGGA